VKGLTDTSPEAERVLVESYRRMPFAEKWRQMGAIYRTARALHAFGVRLRNPAATPQQIAEDWALQMRHGARPSFLGEQAMNTSDENFLVLREVIGVFERLEIPHALGGSWASSLLGRMRFTQDADLSVEPFPGKEDAFCESFGSDYYLSRAAVRQALRERGSFNIVNTRIGFKVDVFIRKDRPFDQSVMQRRRRVPLPDSPDQTLSLVTPEDIILLKLEWYRLGGESSDRQWGDVLGVFQVQAEKLDQAYLDRWANELKVTDLLERARRESAL
jgi:hypothetical protein